MAHRSTPLIIALIYSILSKYFTFAWQVHYFFYFIFFSLALFMKGIWSRWWLGPERCSSIFVNFPENKNFCSLVNLPLSFWTNQVNGPLHCIVVFVVDFVNNHWEFCVIASSSSQPFGRKTPWLAAPTTKMLKFQWHSCDKRRFTLTWQPLHIPLSNTNE